MSPTGNIGDSGDDDDNSYHVVSASNGFIDPTNCRVDGVTIRQGYADSDVNLYQGAGFRCYNGASPRFHNCTFTLNEVFSDGFQDGLGGAVYVDEGSPVFTLCLFKGNFVYGRAYGGAVCVDSGSNAEFICCNFGENEASWGGAVAAIGQSAPLLLHCLIADNYTHEVSGIRDATGAGVAVMHDASIEIINCTIAYNESQADGGGVGYLLTEATNAVIHNSIIWGNVASTGDGDEIYFEDSEGDITVTYSNVRDRNGAGVYGSVSWGSGNIGENTSTHDPLFYDLNDYRIFNCSSPCVNAGNASVIPDDTYDVDGDSVTNEDTPDRDLEPRVAEGVVNMGAYEVNCLMSP